MKKETNILERPTEPTKPTKELERTVPPDIKEEFIPKPERAKLSKEKKKCHKRKPKKSRKTK